MHYRLLTVPRLEKLLLLMKSIWLLHPALVLLSQKHWLLLLLSQLLLESHLLSGCWSRFGTLGSKPVCLGVCINLIVLKLHIVLNLLALETAIHRVNILLIDVLVLLLVEVELLTEGLRVLIDLCLVVVAVHAVILVHFHLHSVQTLLSCFVIVVYGFSIFDVTLSIVDAIIVIVHILVIVHSTHINYLVTVLKHVVIFGVRILGHDIFHLLVAHIGLFPLEMKLCIDKFKSYNNFKFKFKGRNSNVKSPRAIWVSFEYHLES